MKLLGRYVPQFVYGSFDGIVTTFAVVAAGAAAEFSSVVIVILGLANLFADGFSMGSSAYLSYQSERHNKKSPAKMSLATFLAFLAVGFVPVVPYLIDVVGKFDSNPDILFGTSIALAALAFLWVGYAKSINSKKSLLRSLVETFVLGVVAAGLAYAVGAFLKNAFGV